MRYTDFLKDKIWQLICLFLAVVSIEILLLIYPFGNFVKIYIPVSLFSMYFLGIGIEYVVKKHFYDGFWETLRELEEKYLITEIVKTPNFLEGKWLKEILEQIDKSMLEHVNKYKHVMNDYKEYIELWIHEIKLPIAASKMVIENHKNSVTKSIDEELRQA